MPGDKQNHDKQIAEYRKKMQPPFQPTDYTGLKLDSKLADQIEQQGLGDILTFERVGDKTRIQAKLPEKGYDPESGKEYNIRINMNYLLRGMVRGAMTESDGINEDKVLDMFYLGMAIQTSEGEKKDEAIAKFTEAMGVPEEAREDFKSFLLANTGSKWQSLFDFNQSPFVIMQQEISKMAGYQKLMADGQLPKDMAGTVDSQKWDDMMEEMKAEYENLVENYRLMAEMDPVTEKRVLQPSDCTAFANYTSSFIDQHNKLREHENKPPLRCDVQDYTFNSDSEGFPKQEEKDGKVCYFYEHHLLTVPVELDGKSVVLTLENTAPPCTKIFERPAVERTGVGLFESENAVKQFHYSVNLGEFNNKKEYDAFNRFINRAKEPPKLTPDSWEAEALHAKETAKGSADPEKISDCFARHLLAQSVVEAAGRTHRPHFDKKTLDRSVEELKRDKSFRLMAQVYGPERMRRALTSLDPRKASVDLFAPQNTTRYAVNDTTRKRLHALGADMDTKGRSEEWQKLRDALTDPEMKDTSRIFDAVEAYTKGKKSVRRTKAGRDSFDLAMTALSLAAKNGDPAAKQRAQNLVDRINKVRGSANPEHKNHVSLEAYEPKAPEQTQQKALGSERAT